jgi:hypothetical protein
MCTSEDAHLVALNLCLTVMYDFVNFPRDIAGTPFPSADSQIQPTHLYDNRGEYYTHETSCPAFKGSLLGSLMRVDVKLGSTAMVGIRTCFMDARCVNYVIPRSRRHAGEAGPLIMESMRDKTARAYLVNSHQHARLCLHPLSSRRQ